jgi:NAD(P)-dependent dehydrogenase (short-subunit alcohol dehydrogenase family)
MEKKNRNLLLAAAAGLGSLLAWRAFSRSRHALNLKGKVVLITGGSRGLGLEMARQLADEGARLAICSRHAEDLETARQELTVRGAEVLAVRCDITNQDEVRGLVAQVQDQFGRIDVVINNAGVIQVAPLEELTLHDFEEAMNTHFWAPLYTTLAVLPQMKERRAGRIVNISSVGGKVPLVHQVSYTSSKFALVGLSEGLRAELKKDGILVTTISPGLTRTGSARHAIIKGQHEKEYAWFSTLDMAPGITQSVEKAARRIIEALRYGEAEVVLSLPGKVLAGLHGLFPGLVTDTMGQVNRLLPEPGGIGKERVRGYESLSEQTPDWAQARTEEAARENNEMRGSQGAGKE